MNKKLTNKPSTEFGFWYVGVKCAIRKRDKQLLLP